MTNATILIDQNHYSGQPRLVAHYEMGGLKGKVQFSAAIPAHWGDDDLIELIFLPLEKRENHNYPQHGKFQPETMGLRRSSSFGSARRRELRYVRGGASMTAWSSMTLKIIPGLPFHIIARIVNAG